MKTTHELQKISHTKTLRKKFEKLAKIGKLHHMLKKRNQKTR